ncbi:unnamed protein product [Ascophyllum nodosum]
MICGSPPSIRALSGLGLGALVATILLERSPNAALQASSPQGSTGCPLDISVLWTADVESPVYSTPVILPSSTDGRKQIVLATLRQAVELLEGDGTVPYLWPIELQGSAFHASPVLHDVDGDGVQDFCVADTSGWIRWLTPGERGPYMPMYRLHIEGRGVATDLYKGLDGADVEAYVLEGEGAGARRGHGEVGNTREGPDGAGGTREGVEQVDPGRRRLMGLSEDVPEGERVTTGADPAAFSAGGTDFHEFVEGEDQADILTPEEELPDAYTNYVGGDMYEWDRSPNDNFGDIYWGQGYMDDLYWDWAARDTDAAAVNGRPGTGVANPEFFVADAHVLAPPVFVDVDGGGGQEMIIPVSYFQDPRHASRAAEKTILGGYVSGSLLCWDIGRSEWRWTHDLGEAVTEMERGAYVYSSPTVADLEGDGSLEVVMGTALGALHVLDAATGKARTGFPVTYDSIKGQVAVADVDGDGQLEMLFGDSSGVVACVKPDGSECWNIHLSGAISSTVTMGDIDGDGELDVVVGLTTSTGSGEIWVLKAETGESLPHFPVRLMNRKGISTPTTLVNLHELTAASMSVGEIRSRALIAEQRGSVDGDGEPIGGKGAGLHLLSPSEDGHVYVIEGASGCVNKIDLGERLLSMVLVDDLDGDGTLDLLVGTMSGEVVALSTHVPFHPLNAWRSGVRGQLNGFVHGGYQGVYFKETRSEYERVVGRYFAVTFEIVDKARRQEDVPDGRSRHYQITISAGTKKIFRHAYDRPGVYQATLALETPGSGLLHINMVNEQGLSAEDYVSVGYNTGFHAVLRWMLVAPVVLASLPFLWISPRVNDGGTNLPA